MSIAVLSDAHLLMQAEWIENESQILKERKEVLENFHKAVDQVVRDSPRLSYLPVICLITGQKEGKESELKGKKNCERPFFANMMDNYLKNSWSIKSYQNRGFEIYLNCGCQNKIRIIRDD